MILLCFIPKPCIFARNLQGNSNIGILETEEPEFGSELNQIENEIGETIHQIFFKLFEEYELNVVQLDKSQAQREAHQERKERHLIERVHSDLQTVEHGKTGEFYNELHKSRSWYEHKFAEYELVDKRKSAKIAEIHQERKKQEIINSMDTSNIGNVKQPHPEGSHENAKSAILETEEPEIWKKLKLQKLKI